VDLVERLLAARADPAAANDEGTTAADLARAAGHVELADQLSRMAADDTSSGHLAPPPASAGGR
jgi:ankyrin repeat protein